MAFELKPGQGSFFKNDKQGNDSRPDYRGEINIDGTMYRISGWIKEGKSGKWMSLSTEPKETGTKVTQPRAEANRDPW